MNDIRSEARAAYYAEVIKAWRKRSFFVSCARDTADQLKSLGFRACLDNNGSLLIADMTGLGRDLSRFVPAADIAAMFDTLAAGLTLDPELLGLMCCSSSTLVEGQTRRPEPQAVKPARMRAKRGVSDNRAAPEEAKTVSAESCVHCGLSEEWTGNLLLKIAVVDVGVKTWVHAKCWANWRAKQEGEPVPPETPTDDGAGP
jgi:hypothetical protein